MRLHTVISNFVKDLLCPLRNSAVAAIALTAIALPVYSQEMPAYLDGTMMPYDFSLVTPPQWPDSLKPVHIAYIARHGARFLSSEKKIAHIRECLEQAEAEGKISEKGIAFLSLIRKVENATGTEWGALNSVGREEQRRLGKEMATAFPGLTENIEARATYVPRVVMSMYEFCHSVAVCNAEAEVNTSEGQRFNSLLRFFTTDPEYVRFLKEKPWEKDKKIREYIETLLPAEPARRLYNHGVALSEEEAKKETAEMYGILQSLRASDLTAPTTYWMSEGEYSNCWKASNLEHYYARTRTDISSIPTEAARPLLDTIIMSTDQALGMDSVGGADLWFGHAETLMPLLSLMNVEGCNAPAATPEEVCGLWKDYEVVPLGANLELIFLKSAAGRIYLLARHNGRHVGIGPFSAARLPEWNEVKAYWEKEMRVSKEE